MSDLVAAGVAASGVMGHDFGCRSATGLACDCDTARVASAVAAALGVEALAEGHVRLVLDLQVADARELLQDVKWLNDSEARAAARDGVERRNRPWRAIARDAAAEQVANRVGTHRVSHTPVRGFALGPLAHAVTTSEAAEALGVSLQRVRHLCRTGKLRAQQAVGGRRGWSVDAEAVNAVAAARRLSGLSVPPGSRPCGGELT